MDGVRPETDAGAHLVLRCYKEAFFTIQFQGSEKARTTRVLTWSSSDEMNPIIKFSDSAKCGLDSLEYGIVNGQKSPRHKLGLCF